MSVDPQRSTRNPSETEARLSALLDTAVDGVIVIDEHGIVETFNKSAARMFGYAPEEVLGRNVNMLMPEPFAREHDRHISQYLKTGRARIIGIGREISGLRKDGATFPMDLSVSEVRAGGRRTFMGVIRDLTSRKGLEEAMVMTSETERRIIGQDLHDVLGQQLTGLSLLTKALAQRAAEFSAELAKEAENVGALARETLNELRRISHGLYPTELERHGLCSALVELAETHSMLFKVPCRYKGAGQVEGLSKVTALHLYRIAQEAVSNAIKHSGCRRIDITLETHDDALVLTVRDDGRGLPAKKPSPQGMGLRIMKYRASMSGAAWHLESGERGGTVVRCVVQDWKRTGTEKPPTRNM